MNFVLGGNTIKYGLGTSIRRASAVTPVDPGILSGLTGRWLASSLSGLDNSMITSWSDSSGNGRTLTPPGGGEPTLKTAVFNGGKAVRCLDAQRLNDGSSSGLITTSAFTILMAMRVDTLNSYPTQSYSNPNIVGDASLWWGVKARNGLTIDAYVYSGVDKYAAAGITTATETVVAVRQGASKLAISLDGGAETETACGAADSVGGNFLVGPQSSTGIDLYIAEICIFNVRLSDSNLASAVAWLKQEYSI